MQATINPSPLGDTGIDLFNFANHFNASKTAKRNGVVKDETIYVPRSHRREEEAKN